MRPLRFLVPGTTGRFRCGGLQVELQTARLTAQLRPTEVVTYRQREPDYPFLRDLLRQEPLPGSALWVVSWGFDVPKLLGQLKGRAVAYHAHSSGYGFNLPPGVPVLAVSRNTLGYWGDRAPRNPLMLVPNALEPHWLDRDLERDIDVLVQARKTSTYVLKTLVPSLRRRGLRVEVQRGWVDDLVELFNRSRVVLYDSADYWRGRGVSEGFGLPPLEAMACRCVVFSSLNHALADFLDPGRLGHQIGFGTLEADLERISAAAADPQSWRAEPQRLTALLESCGEPELIRRWGEALELIDQHWDRLLGQGPGGSPGTGEPPLRSLPPWRLRWRQRVGRLQGWLPS
ncbi:glycosyltransferase [Synechococcus sp. RedBA-s]|uniref:glycosyltransferase n=1 Tax=Synechococcus sp. RedBA-s TaxID=2823741 RepID=UPI0020CBAB12|nr:glycosyltransferase [Synechococcus sp. RedBA-s]MCP9799752.1 glycosyltransferase [Synechococcus sp. RedBA-s]